MFTWWEKLIGVALLVVLISAAVATGLKEVREKHEFMAECRIDKKKYECDALWRAGESHAYPVVMPVYMGR